MSVVAVSSMPIFCCNQVVMKEFERILKLYPGNKLSEYISKNGMSSNDAQMGVQLIEAMVKDSKVTRLSKSVTF